MATIMGAFLLNVLAGITATCVVWLVLTLYRAITNFAQAYFWIYFLQSVKNLLLVIVELQVKLYQVLQVRPHV